MARVAAIEPAKADPSLKDLFDDFLRERGAVPNMFRTLAHDPKLLQTWFDMFRATLREGEVTTRVKEMVAVRVSHLNQSRYCLGSHTGLAKRFGVTEQQLSCLTDASTATFTDAERAAIAFAEELTRSPQGVSDATFAELRKHWSERQIVEITAVAAMFNSFNRFNNALGVDLTVYPQKLG
ncbi:MAG TPA: peroxidase-related enzyme [Planctomycetota bacterium]|nr:peroxidase-related enzyme [Planctomycetota bacterium]